MTRRRVQGWAGIAGPALFVAAWSLAGAVEPDYSPVDKAISRLAAVGASSRLLMIVGLVAFGVGILLYARALRASIPGPAWKAAIGSGLATFGTVAFPLGWTSAADDLHAAFAVAAYVALVAVPLLAARPLADLGHRRAAGLSVVAGVASAICLTSSLLGAVPGLLQRVGLTLIDTWIVASAIWNLQRGCDMDSGGRR